MTAASPKSPSVTSPSRHNSVANNNSTQVSGVFGKCTEPIPTNIASIRQQQQSAQRAKSESVPTGNFQTDDGFSSNKTVSKPKLHSAFTKKAGSQALPEVNIFSPPAQSVHKVRKTQQHTDPFAETRIRDNGHHRKNLVPESSLKDDKPVSIRVAKQSKLKYDSPFASDVVETGNSPSPMSPKAGKHCPRQEGSQIFAAPEATELSVSGREPSTNSRFQHSQQGYSTMHNELTNEEVSQSQTIHKKMVGPQKQTMEGVFSIVERKTRHPNYKFQAPFARQGSIAATVKLNGRRHQRQSESAKQGEVVSPFASALDTQQASPLPAEFSGSRPRRVFQDKHTSKTPFARQGSLPPSKNANYSKRVFKQQPSSPFATHEGY
eukprot:GILI01002445.1.p1 GENE.GILI01002445.1~~GILI01002445.1.p1  ORF type:complete len:378 (+),score=120.98 GILI01002445.1:198-1331(+)